MLELNRREVLKALGALGLGGSVLPFGLSKMAFGAEGSPLLIVIHLRGGCDGLNLISPSNDADFIAARASDLRVLSEGKDAGYPLANGLGRDIDFRLHVSAGGMSELYKNGNLAFVHACGLTDATRSHFVATDMIEAGVGAQSDLARSESGWLSRFLDAQAKKSVLQGVAVSGAITGDLRGSNRVIAAPDINNGLPVIGGPPVATALWQMYGSRSDQLGESGRLALQLPVTIDEAIPRDKDGHVIAYTAENGASYDNAGGFANALKTVARLIKMDIGLQVITVDYGAFDTHENQASRFRGQIDPLSKGLADLWNDIEAYHDRVTVVTVTEFGRRLRSNKSNGTDHGRAGVMAVLGGQVRGGRMYGKWPGLASAQLDEGVDLAVTTDYRQVLSEIIAHNGGRKDPSLFPNFKMSENLGLFS